MTGSTGFLGGKLIKDFVKSGCELYLLVRDFKKAKKIKSTFKKEQSKRIHILQGDIVQPYCGLSSEEIDMLANKIDVVYHLAALVKFNKELRKELFDINFNGTQNVLELANEINAKKFLYVSTAYTVGQSENGIEQLYPKTESYNNPYEESKVKSEHLVFDYKDKMDVSIFRPSIIVGDSITGEANSTFTLYGFIRGLDVFKKRIEKNKTNNNDVYHVIGMKDGTSNFVPINYVSDVLSIGKNLAQKNKIYHITNSNPPKNKDVLDLVKDMLNFKNVKIIGKGENYSLRDEEIKLNKMIEVFDCYLGRDIKFDDINTKGMIDRANMKSLMMDKDMLRTIIEGYKK